MTSDKKQLAMVSLQDDLVDDDEDPSSIVPDIEIPEVQPLPPQTGLIMTMFNLLNALLGSGIIAIPNSIHSSGIIPAAIIMALIAALNFVTTSIIYKLQIKYKAEGYDSLVGQLLGKGGQVVFSVFLLLFLITNMVSYLIIGGDIITSWFQKANINLKPLEYHAAMIFVYSLILPVPITVPRGIKFISFFSSITFICMLLYLAVMFYEIYYYFGEHRITETTYSLARWDFFVFSAISIYSQTFNLPAFSLSIVYHYEENYVARKKVAGFTILLCFVLTFTASTIGYCIFGENTYPNILLNFEPDEIAITFVRIAFFIIVNSSFPLMARSVEATWSEYIFKINNAELLEGWRRAVILVLTCAVPVILAMFLPQAKPAMAIGSASGGFVVAYVFPGILYLKSTKKPKNSPRVIASYFLVVFGVIFTVLSTYASIREAIKAYTNV